MERRRLMRSELFASCAPEPLKSMLNSTRFWSTPPPWRLRGNSLTIIKHHGRKRTQKDAQLASNQFPHEGKFESARAGNSEVLGKRRSLQKASRIEDRQAP